jgi:UPF0755 protein
LKLVLRRAIIWGALTLIMALGLALVCLQVAMQRPYAGWSADFIDVELETGLDAGSMLERLRAEGVIRNPDLVRIWLQWSGGSKELQAGEYRFSEPASPMAVVSRLRQGDVLLHAVTIPEGLVLEDIARRLDQAGLGSADELMALFRDPAPVAAFDPEASDLEGYLFPETYRFSRQATPSEVSRAMIARFREVAGEEYAAAAEKRGLTLREAVTLASLIEKETSVADERTMISRVFHNRLQRGMRLQCDPTVLYALRREGIEVRALTYDHLEIDSPWNTYVVGGLPPGPISNAGAASLEAAVNPAEGKALYFVAAPGGGHRFSDDLASHVRAVNEWRAYSRSSR